MDNSLSNILNITFNRDITKVVRPCVKKTNIVTTNIISSLRFIVLYCYTSNLFDNMEIDINRKVEFVGGCVHADQV